MVCEAYFAVAAALVAGNIAVCVQGENVIKRTRFRQALGPKLEKMYERVIAERRTLYYTGLGWGLVIAAIISYLRRGKRVRVLHAGCMACAITLAVAYLYYMLMPKRLSMLPHLDSAKQRMAWKEVYTTFKRNYIIGMVLGALAGGFLGAGFCTS